MSFIFRTFGNSRGGNFRPQGGFRNPPAVDPAIETNEITPARQLTEDAPNAPAFVPQQGFRRPPPPQGSGFNLRRAMERMVGGMRTMFQGLNRRAGPNRRIQEPVQHPQPEQQVSSPPPSRQSTTHSQTYFSNDFNLKPKNKSDPSFPHLTRLSNRHSRPVRDTGNTGIVGLGTKYYSGKTFTSVYSKNKPTKLSMTKRLKYKDVTNNFSASDCGSRRGHRKSRCATRQNSAPLYYSDRHSKIYNIPRFRDRRPLRSRSNVDRFQRYILNPSQPSTTSTSRPTTITQSIPIKYTDQYGQTVVTHSKTATIPTNSMEVEKFPMKYTSDLMKFLYDASKPRNDDEIGDLKYDELVTNVDCDGGCLHDSVMTYLDSYSRSKSIGEVIEKENSKLNNFEDEWNQDDVNDHFIISHTVVDLDQVNENIAPHEKITSESDNDYTEEDIHNYYITQNFNRYRESLTDEPINSVRNKPGRLPTNSNPYKQSNENIPSTGRPNFMKFLNRNSGQSATQPLGYNYVEPGQEFNAFGTEPPSKGTFTNLSDNEDYSVVYTDDADNQFNSPDGVVGAQPPEMVGWYENSPGQNWPEPGVTPPGGNTVSSGGYGTLESFNTRDQSSNPLAGGSEAPVNRVSVPGEGGRVHLKMPPVKGYNVEIVAPDRELFIHL